MRKDGAWSEWMVADEEAVNILSAVTRNTEKFEHFFSEQPQSLTVLQYRRQTVNGFNYDLRVLVDGQLMRMQVYKQASYSPELMDVKKE